MNRSVLTSSAWLLALIVVFLAWFALMGKLQFEPHGEGDDAAAYVAMSEGDFFDFWRSSDNRNYSWGYPLLLRLVRPLTPEWRALPLLQVLWHVLGVVIFWAGMRQVSGSEWLALAVSGTLLFSNPGVLYNSGVGTDGPTAACAVATVGLLLCLVARPANVLAWLGLTVCLFLTYQMRSAYLFLIGLVPLLGLLVGSLVQTPANWARLRVRFVAGLLAVSVVPFAGYAAASWAASGELGLPVMGTFNLFGITSPYLGEKDMDALPEDVRPVMARFLKKRRIAERTIDLTFPLVDPDQAMRARGPGQGGGPLLDPATNQPAASAILQNPLWTDPTVWWEDRGPVLSMRGYLRGIREELIRMNLMMMLLAESAGEVLAESGAGRFSRPQEKLMAVSKAAIKAQPGAYAGRLVRMVFLGVVSALVNSYVLVLLYGVAIVLAGVRCLLVLVRRPRPRADAAEPAVGVPGYDREFAILFLIATGFTLAKLLLVVVVTVPILRYTDAAGVFVPAMVMVGVFRMGQTLRRT